MGNRFFRARKQEEQGKSTAFGPPTLQPTTLQHPDLQPYPLEEPPALQPTALHPPDLQPALQPTALHPPDLQPLDGRGSTSSPTPSEEDDEELRLRQLRLDLWEQDLEDMRGTLRQFRKVRFRDGPLNPNTRKLKN